MKRAKFGYYPVVEIRRTWKRDGSHPLPGALVREDRFTRRALLRVDDVKELGLIGALCRKQFRLLEKTEVA